MDQTLRLHMGSSSTIRACWSMSVLRSRHVYSVAARSTGFITRSGAPTTCDGAESDVVRCAAGHPRSAAVSNERYASGDALLPSSPGGPLHDGDGFVAATYNGGSTGTSAIGYV